MAPDCPEEVDVFTVPHSRMKELVHKYLEMTVDANFSDVGNLTTVLKNLHNTFHEFQTHEQIENKYIMKKLKEKLKKLSIRNTAVCNCHSDNRLTEMMLLFKDGYKLTRKSVADRVNYGFQLRKELEDFTDQFLPHMAEEEAVFQPLLMKYFSFEELKRLKNTVIQQHVLRISKLNQETEEKIVLDELTSESSSDEEEEKSEKEVEACGVDKLPNEIVLNIFQYLNPKDLLNCAQVSHRWNNLAHDGTLWKTLCPVQWSRGNWTFRPMIDVDEEEQKLDVMKQFMDEVTVDDDADIDEADQGDDCLDVKQIRHEAKMLTSVVKYLLPRIGSSVRSCNMAYSKGLTNGMLYKILSQCPNLEELDLTQTHISDIGFKGLGKKGCGKKLKYVDLSGCVNITDVTLQRLSSALGYLNCHIDVQNEEDDVDDQKLEKNETEVSEKLLEYQKLCDKENVKDNISNALQYARDSNNRKITACSEYIIDKDGKSLYSSEVKSINEYDTQIKLECDKDFDAKFGSIAVETSGSVIRCSGSLSKVAVNKCVEVLNFEAVHKTLLEICDQFDKMVQRDASLTKTNRERNITVPSLQSSNVHVENTATFSDLMRCKRTICCGHLTPERTCKNDLLDMHGAKKTESVCDTVNKELDNTGEERTLEFLSLSGCLHITDQGIRSLADNGGLPHLHHLDLSGCFRVTADGVTSLVSVCPSLSHEFLFYCDNMYDDPFTDTASGCQNLECRSRFCCRTGN